jgi:NAD(P)H-hydrate epimerase
MPVPIISVEQMRAWECATWSAGVEQDLVIRKAGRAAAEVVRPLIKPGDRVLVLAGKGHNGDDACRMAENLTMARVELLRIHEPGAALSALMKASPGANLVVDGLFGIGLNRPLSAEWVHLINAVNEAGKFVVAVDVPTGLNADTGESLGAVLRANVTITLAGVKRGLLASAARAMVGRIVAVPDIGLIPCPIDSPETWIIPGDFQHWPPNRPAQAHKGTFGHVVILAGSLGYHGAAVLAARGAEQARPGLVTLVTQPDVFLPVASQLTATMVHPWTTQWQLPVSTTAIVIGPGLAAENIPPPFRQWVSTLWQDANMPMVVDASALDWLPRDRKLTVSAGRVITPHPGEAARLLGVSPRQIQAERRPMAVELARRMGGCHVILKGQETVIADENGLVQVNSSGNPDLAQGGAGDILAGFLGGLLAPPGQAAPFAQVLGYAVWRHGHAADQLSRTHRAWIITELPGSLGLAADGESLNV